MNLEWNQLLGYSGFRCGVTAILFSSFIETGDSSIQLIFSIPSCIDLCSFCIFSLIQSPILNGDYFCTEDCMTEVFIPFADICCTLFCSSSLVVQIF